MHLLHLVSDVAPILRGSMNDVGRRNHVLVQMADDARQVVGVLQPRDGAVEARNGVHVPPEAPHRVVADGGLMFGWLPLVEHREEAERRAAVGVEVAHQHALHVLQHPRVVLRPHQAAERRRQALQPRHPRPADAHAAPHPVLHEHPVQMGVLHQRGTDKCPVVPRLQPLLYLRVFHPMLDPLVALDDRAIQCRSLPVQQSRLSVEDARPEVVPFEQVAHRVGQVVILAPRYDTFARHGYRVTVPVLAAQVEELRHRGAPVHRDGILPGGGVHKRKFSYLFHDFLYMFLCSYV